MSDSIFFLQVSPYLKGYVAYGRRLLTRGGTASLMTGALWACAPALPVGTAPVEGCPGGSKPVWPGVLVEVDCVGELQPRLVVISVDSTRVTFQIVSNGPWVGPVLTAAEIVERWPNFDQEPWLGHLIRRIVVVNAQTAYIEFGERGSASAALFGDPRLGLGPGFDALDQDRRNDMDIGLSEAVTTHAPTLAYARAKSWDVDALEWGLAYHLVVPGGADWSDDQEAAGMRLVGLLGSEWMALGAIGDRFFSPPLRNTPAAQCGLRRRPGDDSGRGEPRQQAAGAGVETLEDEVFYRAGDAPGRQIAERLVSASLRRGEEADLIASLLLPPWPQGDDGRSNRAPPRLRASPLEAEAFAQALRDGRGRALVSTLPWGPIDGCTTLGEIRSRIPWAVGMSGDAWALPRVLQIGVLRAYRIVSPGDAEEAS